MSLTPGPPVDSGLALALKRRHTGSHRPATDPAARRHDETGGTPRLHVRDATGERSIRITRTPYTIGRRETNDLQLSGTEVSREDAADLVGTIVAAVQRFAAGAPQSDDITAMVVRYGRSA